jgi:hypothetical protein
MVATEQRLLFLLFKSLDQAHLDGTEQVIWTGAAGHTKGGPLNQLLSDVSNSGIRYLP